MIKKLRKLMAMALVVVIALSCSGVTAFAAETDNDEQETQPIVKVSFDLNDRVKHEATVTLPDGTTATVGAEPVATTRALSGTWRIYGYNPLATMEYYIDLAPSGSYTTITNTYGLAISGTLSSFENEKINVVRRTETSSKAAVVEGYAKFNYLGNQWVSIWTQSGGVRASIKNNVVSTELY